MKKYIALFIGLALFGTANAKLVSEDKGGASSLLGKFATATAETTVFKKFDTADNNAHTGTKTTMILNSINGDQYRLFGHVTTVIAGNDNGTMDSLEDKIRELTGYAISIMKNCSNCDATGTDMMLWDFKTGGSLFGHNVKFANLYVGTTGVAYRVDPGWNDPKRIDGVELNNTNINLGKGNNGKYYGMRFNPITLTVEFFENIGVSGEVKRGEINMRPPAGKGR